MKIFLANNRSQSLDVPANISLQATFVSPLFETGGAWSLPLTLPHTPKNDTFFSYDGKFYAAQVAHTRRFEVIVETGSMVQRGTLILQSVSSNGYEVTVTMQDANYFSRLENLTLADCVRGQYFSPDSGIAMQADDAKSIYSGNASSSYQSKIDKRKKLLKILQARFDSNQTSASLSHPQLDEFFIFPVKTKDKNLDLNDISNYSSTLTFNNSNELGNTNLTDDTKPCPSSATLPLVANFRKGDMYGYGVTVFLKLHYVIEQVFKKIGYSLTYDFGTTVQGIKNRTINNRATGYIEPAPYLRAITDRFYRLCILNNTADSIMPGYIPYEALVPDTSCIDFLQTLFAEFGLAFFEDRPMHVTVRFMMNILDNPHTEFPCVLPKDYDITFSDPAGIKLSHKTIKPDGWNEETDLAGFFKKYPAAPLFVKYAIDENGKYMDISNLMSEGIKPGMVSAIPIGGTNGVDTDKFKIDQNPYDIIGDLSDITPDVPAGESIIVGEERLRYVEGFHTDEYKQAICSDLSSFDTWGNVRVCSEPGHLPLVAPDSFEYKPAAGFAEVELKSALTDCPTDVLLCNSKNPYGDLNYLHAPAPVMDGIRNVTCNVKVGTEEQKQTECPLAFALFAGKYTSWWQEHDFTGNETDGYTQLENLHNSTKINVPYATRALKISQYECSDHRNYPTLNPYDYGYAAWRLNTRFAVEYFHKDYNELLSKGLHTLTFTCYLSAHQIAALRFDTIYYKGMFRFLIKQIETTISEKHTYQETTITAILL